MIPSLHQVVGYMQKPSFSPDGNRVSFMLPVNGEFYSKADDSWVKMTVWWDVYCSGRNAGTVMRNGAKGRRVMVRSIRIEPEMYEKDGIQRLKIVAYDSSVTFLDPKREEEGWGEVDQD